MIFEHLALLGRRRSGLRESPSISEVREDVFFVEGPASNWTIVREGNEFILIDSGYPADGFRVMESIRTLGLQPRRAAAMLITHAHSDHVGSASHFSRFFGTPILAAPAELPHLAGEEQHRVTVPQVLASAGRGGTLPWLVHAVRAGGLKKNNVQGRAWDPELLAALPGGPVAVPTPGHTPGHTSYLLPRAGAVATGDAVVTGHPTSGRAGVQLLHPMFHHQPELVSTSLSALAEVNATVILPGHGPAMEGPLSALLAPLAP